ncbi:unnamed protein product [Trichobilharzia szidati]|nr:unnamed protein product [Trichobilharzia szidati]
MQVDTGISHLGLKCQQINNVAKDYEFLTALHGQSEQSGMKILFKMLGRLSKDCGGLWTVNEESDWLILYIFFRCYGWKDIDLNDVRSQILVPSATQRYRNLSKDEELKMKDKIILLTTELINLIKDLPLTLAGLKMFISSIHLARGMHHTRKQMALFAVDWLTFGLETAGGGAKARANHQFINKVAPTQPFLPEDSTPETMFMTVKDLIWICCTDNNRVIRTSTLGALHFLFAQLSVNTVVRLIRLSLEVFEKPEMCANESSEGALDMLNLLLKRLLPSEQLSPVNSPSMEVEGASKSNPLVCQYSSDFIQSQMFPRIRAITSNLFNSDYLHVRKAAVRVYLTCLHRCKPELLKETVDQIVKELCISAGAKHISSQENTPSKLESWKTSPKYCETLLDLCRYLIKKVGENNLPPNTGSLQNSLVDFYLSHSSENVRASACNLFLTLFISASKNPIRLRYLMNKVLENWQVRQELLTSPIPKSAPSVSENEKTSGNTKERPLIVRKNTQTVSWTWREGRIHIYSSLARTLVGLHLKVLCDVDTEGCNTTISGEFCVSPTLTEMGNKRSLTDDKLFAQRLSQSNISPTPKSRPSILVIDGDRRSSLNKPLQIVNGSPAVSRARMNNNTSRKSMCLTVLENIRTTESGEKGRQMEIGRAQTWLKRLSTAQAFNAINKTNSRVELDTISMKSMLFKMLQLSTECLLDENVELRSSAKKALSDIGKLIRWYDGNLLLELISSYMLGPPSMMSYATLKLLRDGLFELWQYDEILQMEEQEPGFTEKFANVGTIPILNSPLLFGLFSPEKSRLWLRTCQQYTFNHTSPIFLTILSMECTLYTLCLTHRLPNLSLVACTWETMRPDPLSSMQYSQRKLEVDPGDVAECVKGFVEFAQRIDIQLGARFEPVSNSIDPTSMAATLRPSPSCLQLSQTSENGLKRKSASSNNPLASTVIKVISKLEAIIYPFLPPTMNSNRPHPKVRKIGGLLLSPILPYLITWPLALLPPGLNATSSNLSKEKRLLAVRKILRVTAAITLALPIANQSTTQKNDPSLSRDVNDVLNELMMTAEQSVNLTTVADAYFAQLENIILQLHHYYDPEGMCNSESWWWVRALCEHLPRLMETAPLSNPVNLLRRLIEEIRMKPTDAKRKSNSKLSQSGLWNKALEYSRQEARLKLDKKESDDSLRFRWPKVGEILRAKESIEQQFLKESKMQNKTSNLASVKETDDDEGEVNEDQNRFFLASDDDEDLLYTQQEDALNSSDEEDTQANKSTKGSKLHSLFYVSLKPETIDTPPALKDVTELIERILPHCQPVVVSTIRQILSDSDSVFTPTLEKPVKNSSNKSFVTQ